MWDNCIWLGLGFGSAFAFFAYSAVVWMTDLDQLIIRVTIHYLAF